jgi:flagella basal body P-ring formation protein FlgA
MLRKSLFFAAALVAGQWSADAAEIHFRGEVAVARGIVRLGDVADVRTGDADEARLLEGIALIPAPALDQSRLLKRQEVQQLLQLSGVTLRQHRFSGAEVTKIHAGELVAREPATYDATALHQVPATEAATKSTTKVAKPVVEAAPEALAAQAIVDYLAVVADIPAEWQAEVFMSPRIAQALQDSTLKGQTIVRVEGGVSPWLGRQQFMLLLGNEKAPTRLPVEAEISGTARVVTAARNIEREMLITAQDLQFQTVALQRNVRVELDPAQLIGRETGRALNAGQVVSGDMVRTLRFVRRGEELQVFSVGAGLQISEPAKALADGSQGDTIQVEFADRRKMMVRVTGPRRAEVYAMQTSRSQVQPVSSQPQKISAQPKTLPPTSAQIIRR